jgi:uncharacterized Zn finger protein
MIPFSSISEAAIKRNTISESFSRGKEYYRQGAVSSLVVRGQTLIAEVEGSELYDVQIEFNANTILEAECSCPYDWGGWCKHIVAALLKAKYDLESIEQRPSLESLLESQSREELLDLLIRLGKQDPALVVEIEEIIELRTRVPKKGKKAAIMDASASPINLTTFRKKIESAFAESDSPEALNSFLSEIRNAMLQGRSKEILPAMEQLTNSYLESHGYGGDFFEEYDDYGYWEDENIEALSDLWVELVLDADLSPEEREDWKGNVEYWNELLEWEDEPFWVLERALDEGWDTPAIVKALAGKYRPGELDCNPDAIYKDHQLNLISYLNVRVDILLRKGRIQEAENLASATGMFDLQAIIVTEKGQLQEALTIATERFRLAEEAFVFGKYLQSHGHLAEALTIGALGIKLQGPYNSLDSWFYPFALDQERNDLALASSLTLFKSEPHFGLYQRIEHLAGMDWPALRTDLLTDLQAVEPDYENIDDLINIFLYEKEIDHAITLISKQPSSDLTQKVMDHAVISRPDWVIAEGSRQAQELVSTVKVEAYQPAVDRLRAVRKAYYLKGQSAEWTSYIEQFLVEHKRKRRFMEIFNAMLKEKI